MFAPNDLIVLDAMEAAYSALLNAATVLREVDDHQKAELLEFYGEQMLDETEHVASQLEEGELCEHHYGSDLEFSIEEELARAYQRRISGTIGNRIDSDRELADTIRDILYKFYLLGPRRYATDEDVIAAAKQAYEDILKRKMR